MGNFADCWGKHAGDIFSKGDKKAIQNRIDEHTLAGLDAKEATRLAVEQHLEDEHRQLESVYKQSNTPIPAETADYLKNRSIQQEVRKQKADLVAQADLLDKNAKAATDPDVKERLQATADQRRAEAQKIGTPEYIKENIEPKFAPPEPPKAEVAAKEQSLTGISQAMHEERGSGVQPGEGTARFSMLEEGRRDLAKGVDVEPIFDKSSNGTPLTGKEFGQAYAKIEQLSQVTDRAKDAAEAAPKDPALQKVAEDAQAEEDSYRERLKPAQTEWGAAGMAQQGAVDVDSGSFHGLQRQVKEIHGRDATAGEKPLLKKASNEVKTSDAEAADKLNEATKVMQKLRSPKTQPRTMEELKQHFSDRIKELNPC